MFDGASNSQLGCEKFKINHPKITVMRGVEHTVSLFFKDVSKITGGNQMITDHKAIMNYNQEILVYNISVWRLIAF